MNHCYPLGFSFDVARGGKGGEQPVQRFPLGLTPVKEREKGRLDGKSLRLQCNSGKVSARPKGSPKSTWPLSNP